MHFYPGSLAAASSTHPFVAVLHSSNLVIYSDPANTSLTSRFPDPLQSIPLSPSFASKCSSLRFYSPPISIEDNTQSSFRSRQDPNPRLLLSSAQTLHVYSALQPTFHAQVSNAAIPSPNLSDTHLLSPEDVLAIPDLANKVTIWDLVTGTGLEIRDPKIGLKNWGYTVRPGTGHVALLTRPNVSGSVKDVVVVLSPRLEGGGRNAQGQWTLESTDARGLRWSADGMWLVVWEAASFGAALWVYTPSGDVYKKWDDDAGGQDGVGLGIERCTFSNMNHLCLGMSDGRTIVLSKRTFTVEATIHHPTPIIAVPSDASIHQEQLVAADPIAKTPAKRDYVHAALPVTPPGPSSASQSVATSEVSRRITHLSPCPLAPLLASISAATPTTVWITTLYPRVRTRAVLVHHSAVRSLEWHPQRAGWLLIQCTPATASSSATPTPTTPTLPSKTLIAYVWSDDLPDPLVVNSPIPPTPSTSGNASSHTSRFGSTTTPAIPSQIAIPYTATWLSTSPETPDAIPHVLFSTPRGAVSVPALRSEEDDTLLAPSPDALPTPAPTSKPHLQRTTTNAPNSSAESTPTPAPHSTTHDLSPDSANSTGTQLHHGQTNLDTPAPPFPFSTTKTPIVGHGPEAAFDEGASVDLAASMSNASVDLGFSPVRFDAEDWTRRFEARKLGEDEDEGDEGGVEDTFLGRGGGGR